MVLLDRAFQGPLHRYLSPVLGTVIHSLDKNYPYYQQSLSSETVSPQLTRYITSLIGILQIILRCPEINLDSANEESALQQHVFEQTVKYTQLSDETVKQWIDDPVSATEVDITGPLSVRNTVLECAMEHFRLSFVDVWLQYRSSIQGE
jgi:hypothetical protein